MKFTEWLDAEPGRAKKIAAHFRVTMSAVSQWRENGVPVKRMKAVHTFTRRQVSLSEMVPDIETQQEGA